METIQGTQITGVRPHYEHIFVHTNPDKPSEGFFISSEDLVVILSEFDFKVGKKRTRRWGKVDIDEWRVERFDQPRTY
jgi:hypothetical protein